MVVTPLPWLYHIITVLQHLSVFPCQGVGLFGWTLDIAYDVDCNSLARQDTTRALRCNKERVKRAFPVRLQKLFPEFVERQGQLVPSAKWARVKRYIFKKLRWGRGWVQSYHSRESCEAGNEVDLNF